MWSLSAVAVGSCGSVSVEAFQYKRSHQNSNVNIDEIMSSCFVGVFLSGVGVLQ